MIRSITDFAASRRGKWITLAFWIIVTAIVSPLAPQLADVTTNDQSSFLPSGSESTRVAALIKSDFPSDGTPAIIVFRDANGLSERDLTQAKQVSDWLASGAAGANVHDVVSIYTVPQAAEQLRSPDDTAMTMVVNITGEPAGDAYTATIERIRDYTSQFDTGQLHVKVSGPGGLLADLLKVFQRIDSFLLLVTGALVLVLLILIYRSPVVALVPIVSVGWVFSLASAVGALLAEHAGLLINGQATGIMTVLLFGAGTDYCLFISSRYREELTRVDDPHDAMQRAMRGVGAAVVSAAGTILIATLALLLALLRSNQALGPLLAIAIGVMLLASLTLVPALLAILGRRAFWPFVPRLDPAHTPTERRGIWPRIAALVARWPRAVLASTLMFFVILALGVFGLRQDFDTLSSLPSGTESRDGFDLLRQSFPPGELAPTEVYVVFPAGASVLDAQNLRAVDAITLALAKLPGLSSVSGPSQPLGTAAPVGPERIEEAINALPERTREAVRNRQSTSTGTSDSTAPIPPFANNVLLYSAALSLVSPAGNVARISVTLNDNPYGIDAINRVPTLRETARTAASAAGLAPGAVLVGGPTATNYDTKVANDRDERVVLPLILLAIGIVLVLLLRSLVAPLYLLATSVLTYFSTLGISTIFFQNVLGQHGVSASVPFYLFVFLIALGVDYNIYLMARVREEMGHEGLKQGTVRALARTGGVITSAGIILAGTFAALMTLPLQVLFQLGFAVSLGVLIDTFLVRSLTVPAIVLVLGRWNWWPSRSSRPSSE